MSSLKGRPTKSLALNSLHRFHPEPTTEIPFIKTGGVVAGIECCELRFYLLRNFVDLTVTHQTLCFQFNGQKGGGADRR